MRDLGELKQLGVDVRGDELQHLECQPEAVGAILGRQQRRNDPLLRSAERERDGLLDR